ncbi:MAG TPA: hypothetical protein VJY33_12305, partial [Isosphaeraceae bacterium]|nr:hypothetical protein [Isosphaeraceae bacterium]
LKIEKYKEAMVDYVGRNFINSLVIVPWDKADETSEDAEELQQLLNATFYELTEMGNKRFRIVSSERFIEELDAALDDRLDAILKAPGTTFRKVLGAGPRSKPTFSAARTW